MTILFTIVFRGDRCITAGQTRCSFFCLRFVFFFAQEVALFHPPMSPSFGSKQDDIIIMIIIQLFSCGSLEGRERRIEVQFEIEISMKMEKKKYDGDLKYVT